MATTVPGAVGSRLVQQVEGMLQGQISATREELLKDNSKELSPVLNGLSPDSNMMRTF